MAPPTSAGGSVLDPKIVAALVQPGADDASLAVAEEELLQARTWSETAPFQYFQYASGSRRYWTWQQGVVGP